MDELKKKHAAAVARANEARQEVARLQGVLDRAQAELAGIGNKIRRKLSRMRAGVSLEACRILSAADRAAGGCQGDPGGD